MFISSFNGLNSSFLMQDWSLVQLLLEALSKWQASLQKHGQFNNNHAYSWHVTPTNGNTVDLFLWQTK